MEQVYRDVTRGDDVAGAVFEHIGSRAGLLARTPAVRCIVVQM